MAIIPGLPGLEVSVTVAGEALAEYDYDYVDEGHVQRPNTVSKYIEAPFGAEFEITTLYTPPFDPPLPIHVDIMLDGDYIQATFAEKNDKDGCKGYRFRQATSMIEGLSYTQNFMFAELKTEDIDQPTTEAAKRQASSIGRIVMYLYFTELVKSLVPVEVPTSKPDHANPISQKALKATVTPGDSLAYQTRLSTPKQCGLISYQQVETTENEPFATFVFYYRSTNALKSLGLIERTSSPSPEPEPAPKNIDDMTPEELRAELSRRRNEQEQASRVKREREREDSVATVQEDDDGEVVWLGSQPKRMRKSPGDGDEVVDMET